MGSDSREGQEGFPTTHWSLVARAGQEEPQGRREALGSLLARYAPALRAHLVRSRRLPEERADDLVQQFIADKILEKDLIARADQRLGKFRTFLLSALGNFARNRTRDEHTRRRAPEGGLVALEDRADELPQPDEPRSAFETAWARSVVEETLQRMHCECEQADRMDVWNVFQCRVVGPILENAPPVDYREMIERFGFASPAQATNTLVTAKRMYARILRCVVGQYAADDEEVDEEIAELREILARSR